MKLTSALLVSIACSTYLVSSSPIGETDYDNGDPNNNSTDTGRWTNGYENWYCVKNSNGNHCVVASMESSPCKRGGKYWGCDNHRQHCWGCSVNNNKDWMWNQLQGWCHNQGGSLMKSKGSWHQC